MRNVLRHPLVQAFVLLIGVLAIFFILQAAVAAAFRIGPDNLTPANGLLLGLTGAVAALATVALARRWEGASMAGLGLPSRHAVRHLFAGIAVGGAIQAVAFGVMAAEGWYTVSTATVDLGSLTLMALTALCVGFWEEWAFRGVALRLPEQAVGTWWALVISSLLFGLLHAPNGNASPMTLVGIAVAGGLVLGGGFLLTRSLWLPIGLHIGWNFVQNSVFGTSSSGAGTIKETPLLRGHVNGPELWVGHPGDLESGLILILVGTTTGLILLALAVRAGHIRPTRRKTRTATV
ncbi:lysostaphin resistance A-like protein [Microtetraspora malaysiensis]|uniref:CPBP family intramembrane glutamic endopeptidase n=1 Tax=Microtetraspora malaysiensis TaxID=161358 RepID=UPI003D8C77EF